MAKEVDLTVGTMVEPVFSTWAMIFTGNSLCFVPASQRAFATKLYVCVCVNLPVGQIRSLSNFQGFLKGWGRRRVRLPFYCSAFCCKLHTQAARAQGTRHKAGLPVAILIAV